jgi:hypothetical protein
MDNYFNLKRFTLLFNKHTSEHVGTYSMAVLALFGLMLSCVLFFSLTGSALVALSFQRDIFFLFLWVSGSLFTSNIFADLGNKNKASAALMLPASHFEKFLVSWIYSYLIFQIVYVGVFYLVMFTASSLVNFQGKEFQIYDLSADPKATSWIFLFYMAFHAMAFTGSVYFEKLHFVKTTLVFFGTFMLIILFNEPVLELILNRDVAAPMPFFRAVIIDNNDIFRLDIRKTQKLYLMLIPVVVAGILWITTYFRLREKQI